MEGRMGDEVEVEIQFDLNRIDPDKLDQIRALFQEMGISFDTGTSVEKESDEDWNGMTRDWEWDWSLKGPVRVKFVRFKKDLDENKE